MIYLFSSLLVGLGTAGLLRVELEPLRVSVVLVDRALRLEVGEDLGRDFRPAGLVPLEEGSNDFNQALLDLTGQQLARSIVLTNLDELLVILKEELEPGDWNVDVKIGSQFSLLFRGLATA